MPKVHAAKIDQTMNWFLSVVRPCMARLIKALVGPKAFGFEEPTGEEIEAAKEEFFDDILVRINDQLANRQFMIAKNEPTVVDIIFYNELSTALLLTRFKGYKKRFPNFRQWITLMAEIAELGEQEEKLCSILDTYNLE